MLETLDRFLAHPLVRRPTALFAVYGLIVFLVGAVAGVLGPVTHTFQHTEVLGIVGVALMAFGVLVFVAGWVDIRRRANTPQSRATTTGTITVTEGLQRRSSFRTKGHGRQLVGLLPGDFERVGFGQGQPDSPGYWEAWVSAKDLPATVKLGGRHLGRWRRARITVRNITKEGVVVDEKHTGQQTVRILGLMSPGASDVPTAEHTPLEHQRSDEPLNRRLIAAQLCLTEIEVNRDRIAKAVEDGRYWGWRLGTEWLREHGDPLVESSVYKDMSDAHNALRRWNDTVESADDPTPDDFGAEISPERLVELRKDLGIVQRAVTTLGSLIAQLSESATPAQLKPPRGRLQAHAERGNALLARIDQAMAKGYTGSLTPDSTVQIELQRLAGDMTRWLANAEALVKQLAPRLLNEYHTDYGSGEGEPANLESVAGAFYYTWEPLRQRVDALQRVIDAMKDQ